MGVDRAGERRLGELITPGIIAGRIGARDEGDYGRPHILTCGPRSRPRPRMRQPGIPAAARMRCARHLERFPFARAHGNRSGALFSRASSPDQVIPLIGFCSKGTKHAYRRSMRLTAGMPPYHAVASSVAAPAASPIAEPRPNNRP